MFGELKHWTWAHNKFWTSLRNQNAPWQKFKEKNMPWLTSRWHKVIIWCSNFWHPNGQYCYSTLATLAKITWVQLVCVQFRFVFEIGKQRIYSKFRRFDWWWIVGMKEQRVILDLESILFVRFCWEKIKNFLGKKSYTWKFFSFFGRRNIVLS